jgi:hypothetical protein
MIRGLVQTFLKAPAHFFKELDVEMAGAELNNPEYFEVHFYPDGHVEAAIAESPSEPRLRLDPSREKPAYEDHCEGPHSFTQHAK